MIKFIYDNEADIPAAFKSLYTQNGDGKWVLQCDGAVAKAALDTFRENNVALIKERDALAAKFKDVDPTEYLTLKARSAELEEGKLIKKEGLEAAVELRVKAMKTELDAKLNDTTNRLAAAQAEMGKLKIDTALVTEGAKLGLRPEATRDFVNRGRDVFKLDENGNVVAYEADGQTKKFGTMGTVMTIPEFVQTVAKDKDYSHLFLASGGGGATGAGKGTAPATNPFKTGATFNLTEQAKVLRENPTLATQLKSEAAAAGAA